MVARRFYVARRLEIGLNFIMIIHFLLEPVWPIFLYFTSNFGESKIFSQVAQWYDDIFFPCEKSDSCYAILALRNPKDAASYP